jgi:phosphoribosylformylglycinamidine synthase
VSPRVAIVQFPGVNCEAETARALERVGLEPEIFRWTRAVAELERFDAYVLPGGFSYQDRVRAGALAAKHALTETLATRAGQGVPVLGICNGAQVLAEAGLVPGGGGIELALARNRMPGRSGYHARWVHVRVERSGCLFLSTLSPGELLPLPVAHGEGRFTARDPARLPALVEAGQTPLRYATAAGSLASTFPDNPNGSEQAVAAVCNARGNVLAIMPHPERAQSAGALSRAVGGRWGERRDAALGGATAAAVAEAEPAGPGLAIFAGLARHLGVAVEGA